VSEWPARYLVAEWNTMSAPSSNGRWSAGDANVLSTTTRGRPPPSAPRSVDTTPPARSPAGQVTSTPQGPGVTSGGTNSYQTITTPGGGSAIVVPNGNGTSTIIHSDGKIETVPTPR